uniref:Uncharacterized protein n=1 Tax=Rhizophora mucronata TaxID=61149 RepID=A0A2P2N6L0_RHIMU
MHNKPLFHPNFLWRAMKEEESSRRSRDLILLHKEFQGHIEL